MVKFDTNPPDFEEYKQTQEEKRIRSMSLSEMRAAFPRMREPVIDGILRKGETMNIIASAKMGKSFLAGNLAWSIASGGHWLGNDCRQGRVLIIDDELHKETTIKRIDDIAHGMQIDQTKHDDAIRVINLRGENISINDLNVQTEEIKPGEYALVILDALYRMIPSGTSENDNAQMMAIYNRLDYLAKAWDCAIAVVHHSSKGAQGDKSVVDVGAGAGSISRAADTHLIIRPHEEPELAVLECVTRSFKSPAPISIKFEYPVWQAVAVGANVKKQGQPRQEKQVEDDKKSKAEILEILNKAGKPVRQQRLIELSGFSVSRLLRILNIMANKDKTIRKVTKTKPGRAKKTIFWKVLPAVLPAD